MTDFLRVALGLFATVAPFGAIPVFLGFARLGGSQDRTLPDAGRACAVAFVTLAVFALIAEPFLDFIDVSAESFQFAAGVVMTPLALRLLLAGDSAPTPDAPASGVLPTWLVPLAVPLLASPPAIIAAISYSARFGEVQTIGAAAAVLALAAAIATSGPWLSKAIGAFGVGALGRLSGGLLVVVAVELVVDGVQSV